jgi:hypothetical protein
VFGPCYPSSQDSFADSGQKLPKNVQFFKIFINYSQLFFFMLLSVFGWIVEKVMANLMLFYVSRISVPEAIECSK